MAIPRFRPTVPAPVVQAALVAEGAVILEQVIDGERLADVRVALAPLLAGAPRGSNAFDGFKTRRIFDPLAKTRELDELVVHPVVHHIVGNALPWSYQFGMTILSEVLSDETAQTLHRDAAVYPLPPDFPEVMVNTVWALDEFTADNGATLVALQSHRDKEARDIAPAVMPAGSVLIYFGRLLHGAGANRTDGSRLGLIVEHVARWLRPADCHPIAVGPELAATLPAELQELLGFNQTSDFFGFIAGQSPREWLAHIEPARPIS